MLPPVEPRHAGHHSRRREFDPLSPRRRMSPSASTAKPQTTRPSSNPRGSAFGKPQAQPSSSVSAAGEPFVAVASRPSFPEPLAAVAPPTPFAALLPVAFVAEVLVLVTGV